VDRDDDDGFETTTLYGGEQRATATAKEKSRLGICHINHGFNSDLFFLTTEPAVL
jgi:hypothetical protein